VAHARSRLFPAWDALFDALPLPPLAVGALVALAFLLLFVGFDLLDGNYTPERLQGLPWWLHVEFRNAVAVSLLVAGLVTTYRMEKAGTQLDIARVRPHLAGSPEERARLEREAIGIESGYLLGVTALGALALSAVLPFLYLDPSRFLRARTYLEPAVLFDIVVAWIIGGLTAKQLYLSVQQDRAFARLAHLVPRVDLLDLSPFRPFAWRGLRRSGRWLVLATLASFAFFDAGLFEVPAFALVGIMVFALVTFVLPLRKARDRIRAEKELQLAGLAARIRRERDRLTDGDPSREGGRLADLITLEARLRDVADWPVDAPVALRLAVYLGLPALSWLGGAFFDRLLAAALDR
jgi:hypothetical protein